MDERKTAKDDSDRMGYATVSKIIVDDLFGYYTYELPSSHESDSDLSRLMILYGDNGSGKTTILKLLYHLLSPSRRKGHKTFVAQQRFRRFAVPEVCCPPCGRYSCDSR